MDLPAGTVTVLFTDIEGSTRLIAELGEEGYVQALAEHRRLLRTAFAAHGGVEVDTQGDAFLYAFADPVGALAAAADGQEALASGPVTVRMGLHTGELPLTGEGYAGRELHRAARIAASAHGGQVIVSAATRALVDGQLIELGEHRLKDFDEPVALFQLRSQRFPPLKTISNTNLRARAGVRDAHVPPDGQGDRHRADDSHVRQPNVRVLRRRNELALQGRLSADVGAREHARRHAQGIGGA
jgi:Adenylate and Guanylate cyclase catalytic domain